MKDWTPPLNDSLEIVKSHYLKSNSKPVVKLMDGNRMIPYHFQCPNCQNDTYKIETSISPTFNLKPFDRTSNQLPKEEVIKLNLIGTHYQYFQCNCESKFFFSIGISEFQPGREIIELCSILEVR